MRLLFLGDFLCQSDFVPEDLKNISNQIEQLDCKTVINFEGPFADATKNKRKKRGPNVCQGKGALLALSSLNVAGVCLANNHMMDYNESGFSATVSALDGLQIAHTGAGNNIKEAVKPIIIENNGMVISILNFGWKYEETVYATEEKAGCAALELDFVLRSIRAEKEKGHYVICVFHWGFEYNLYPMPYYRHFAYMCIDEGAELIVGHHPHNIQPYEEYKGHKIFYSLGNFYMGDLRDEFDVDFGIDNTDFYSDYGAGLIFDTDQNRFEGLSIVYNRETRTSYFDGHILFENISEMKYDSKDYYKMVVSGIHGVNPMLTLSNSENDKILKKHLLVCQVYNSLKWIRKVPLFEKAYIIAKRFYTRTKT